MSRVDPHGYGMPHHMCHYETNAVNSHKLDEGAWCGCCGKKAAHAHHEPPRGIGGGKSFLELGGKLLRPGLIALCAQCHDDRHFSDLRIEWVFDDGCADEWFSGWPLERGYFRPHDPILYEMGEWRFMRNGEIVRRVRGVA